MRLSSVLHVHMHISFLYKSRVSDITLTDLSSEQVTSEWPSGEKCTLRTDAVCALKTVDSPLL